MRLFLVLDKEKKSFVLTIEILILPEIEFPHIEILLM